MLDGPERPAVRRRAGDAGDRRLQAAALAGPDRLDPGGRTSTASCARCSSAATSTEVGRDPGPGQAVLFGTTALFLERLGLDSLDDLPPIAEFVPGAGGGRGARGRPAAAGGARPPARSPARRTTTVEGRPPAVAAAGDDRGRPANGCRRSWPGRGLGSRRSVRGADRDGRVTVNGEVARPRATGRRRTATGSRSTAHVVVRQARSRLLPAEQARRRGHHRGRSPGSPHRGRARAGGAAGLPGRPARRRDRGSAPADERRRPDPSPDPPALRGREGVPRPGGRPADAGRAPPPAGGGRAGRRDDRTGAGHAGPSRAWCA